MNLFLTGTDTGVGKTFTTALLTRALREAGHGTIALKPLCSGERSDVEILCSASGNTLSLDETNPVWLQTPAAPLVAAQLENRTLSLDFLADWFTALASKHSSLLVEGAGGWLVPITETQTLADFAVRLGLPVIPVVANRLGCINHALLTIESIRALSLPCPGIILNHLTPAADIAQRTNAQILARHAQILLEIHPGQSQIPAEEVTRFLEAVDNPLP